MNSPDPASLQNLNDIVLPAAIGWWPVAMGWYFLITMVLIALIVFSFQAWRRWTRNHYRRAALYELQLLSAGIQIPEKRDSSLRQLPIVLKRTALSVYPRDQIASLAGHDWYAFLNSQVSRPVFTDPLIKPLDTIAYTRGDLSSVDSADTMALTGAIQYWIKYHRPATPPEVSRQS